jgi:hypothetical protein
MADLQFSRNTKVYLQIGDDMWELPILDGFSFSQATNSTEIVLNEMSDSTGGSRRHRQMFNDSYAPAEWSFSTYVRPNTDGCMEEALWASMISNSNVYDDATNSWTEGVDKSVANTTAFSFASSDVSSLNTFTLFFVLGGCGTDPTTTSFSAANGQTVYKITDSVVNSASIDFEIDGIAMIAWSGFGRLIQDVTDDPTNGFPDVTPGTGTVNLISTGIDDTGNFIRNRLTSLVVTPTDTSVSANTTPYDLVLTGGNITIENNITYLTPETLCRVNEPIGHVTGTRSISGNFTCYLNPENKSSAQLFDDLISATTVVRNSFNLQFGIGGSSAPLVTVTMPTAHLEIPAHSIEDVISLDTAFHALRSPTGNNPDEINISYLGKA